MSTRKHACWSIYLSLYARGVTRTHLHAGVQTHGWMSAEAGCFLHQNHPLRSRRWSPGRRAPLEKTAARSARVQPSPSALSKHGHTSGMSPGRCVAAQIAATSPDHRDCCRCAPVCSSLLFPPSSLLSAAGGQEAARPGSCAPAVHAWHGRPDPWIHLSTQDRVHPIQKHNRRDQPGSSGAETKPSNPEDSGESIFLVCFLWQQIKREGREANSLETPDVLVRFGFLGSR